MVHTAYIAIHHGKRKYERQLIRKPPVGSSSLPVGSVENSSKFAGPDRDASYNTAIQGKESGRETDPTQVKRYRLSARVRFLPRTPGFLVEQVDS